MNRRPEAVLGHNRTPPAPRRAERRSTRRTERDIFDAVRGPSLAVLGILVRRWLPDGGQRGSEWVARNPTRSDRHAGSFSVNLITGRWADFATGDRGGDVVSLAAYIFGLGQGDAARELARTLGVQP